MQTANALFGFLCKSIADSVWAAAVWQASNVVKSSVTHEFVPFQRKHSIRYHVLGAGASDAYAVPDDAISKNASTYFMLFPFWRCGENLKQHLATMTLLFRRILNVILTRPHNYITYYSCYAEYARQCYEPCNYFSSTMFFNFCFGPAVVATIVTDSYVVVRCNINDVRFTFTHIEYECAY